MAYGEFKPKLAFQRAVAMFSFIVMAIMTLLALVGAH
jgi:hypothetical protein